MKEALPHSVSMTTAKCKDTTGAGNPCSKNAAEGCNGYCKIHFKKHQLGLDNSAAVELSGGAGSQTQTDMSDEVEFSSTTLAAIEDIDAQISHQHTIIKIAKEAIKELKKKKNAVTSSKRILFRAKFLFYKEYKMHPDIMADLRPKLMAGGLLTTKTVKVKNETITKEFIPWQYVKEYTDREFMKLQPTDKKPWLEKARTLILASGDSDVDL